MSVYSDLFEPGLERAAPWSSRYMPFAELCVNSTTSADKQYIFANYSVLAVKFLQIPGGGVAIH